MREDGDRGAPRFLRIADVIHQTGLPAGSIYDKMSKGQFPRSIPLGTDAKSRGWIESEVIAWVEERIAHARSDA
jgi:prophage regulatory protein